MSMASQRQRVITPSPRPKRLSDDRRWHVVPAPPQHRRELDRGVDRPKPTIGAVTHPRLRKPVQPLEVAGLGIVGLTIVAVVAAQVIGLRRELAAATAQPRSAVVSAHPRHGDVTGPEFHVEDPEEHAKLAASTRVFNVVRGPCAPTVNAADGVTDLISLA